MTHRSPDWSRVNYENLLFVYILNVLKNLRTVSDLIAKSEKFYAKSDLTKLSWSQESREKKKVKIKITNKEKIKVCSIL